MTSIDFYTFNKTYQISRMLGKGATSKVFLVIDRKNKNKYAMKSINIGTCIQNLSDSFKQVSILSLLDSEFVPSVHYFFLYRQYQVYWLQIILDLCNGTLRHLIKQQQRYGLKWTNKKIMPMLCNLAQLVGHIHGKQIVHRDIKPQNIGYIKDKKTNSITFKLLDFGFSTNFAFAEKDFDFVGGTYAYSSFKIRRYFDFNQKMKTAISQVDDIFSLGKVFIEICLLRNVDNSEFKDGKFFNQLYNINPQLLFIKKMVQPDQNQRYNIKQILFILSVQPPKKETLPLIKETELPIKFSKQTKQDLPPQKNQEPNVFLMASTSPLSSFMNLLNYIRNFTQTVLKKIVRD